MKTTHKIAFAIIFTIVVAACTLATQPAKTIVQTSYVPNALWNPPGTVNLKDWKGIPYKLPAVETSVWKL